MQTNCWVSAAEIRAAICRVFAIIVRVAEAKLVLDSSITSTFMGIMVSLSAFIDIITSLIIFAIIYLSLISFAIIRALFAPILIVIYNNYSLIAAIVL